MRTKLLLTVLLIVLLSGCANVDPTKIAVGLVVTAAGTALTVVTKSVTQKVLVKAIRKAQQRKEEAKNEQKNIPEIKDRSSDED